MEATMQHETQESRAIYRKAKIWQIILYSFNALGGMAIYILMNQVSYAASIGFGISTTVIGVILTASRIFDAITDPMLAFLYDRVQTKYGKLRILIMSGFIIESVAIWLIFEGLINKQMGTFVFVLLNGLYVIGYTLINMTIQTIPALLTNDPKQRPMVGVWTTLFNFLVPTSLSIFLNVVVLQRAGGTFNAAYLSMAVRSVLFLAFVGNVLCCIGISGIDKPENFLGTNRQTEPLKFKDMIDVLKNNKPLRAYIAAAASDKIAQNAGSQAVITTLLYGIIIGDMGLSSILRLISMIPSILFAIIGAKYVGKNGAKKGIVTWTYASIIASIVTVVFFVLIDPSKIANKGLETAIYVILGIIVLGCTMCVTISNSSFMADIVDYELDRTGKYIPAVISGTYSLIDKIISSFGALISTFAIAAIGYTSTVPQPGDEMTTGVFLIAMAVTYGLPILGWIVTLIAMKNCDLTMDEMVRVQERIAVKKEALSNSKNM
ncbi:MULTISPECIES: MFS transporter [unclassified Facklamia]|uniref:MFS transporter n=1 Tax=Aerococcaceae TaxID=186827 RepID=UPI0013B7E5A3|nr:MULTISPECIES: MFS transporter [unclassified Facklamia]MBS4462125.1 MFS transporter [Aerococcaceae bacterium zg-B36]NEW64585.1 sugar transporter [Facklamia sp. 252]NEW67910.1 sugar transporter [Facklamia sp. 253]QQD65398.1 MFS transporter [Aerococcaceae bacterium zg-252]